MSTSSDSAEQVVDMYMKSMEMGLKLTGKMAVHIFAILSAILKEKKQTKGKARLDSMLKTNKELKIYSIKKEDLKIFTQEAKSYGVLYCALINTKNKKKDDIVDIMVKAEDAPKINRIIERFNLTTVSMTNLEKTTKREIVKEDSLIEKQEKDITMEETEKNDEEIDNVINNVIFSKNEEGKEIEKQEKDVIMEETKAKDEEIDDVINNVIFSKNEKEKEIENPSLAKTEKNPPSEHFLKNKNDSVGVTESVEKQSVIKEIEEIKKGQKEKVETELGQVLKKDKESQSK